MANEKDQPVQPIVRKGGRKDEPKAVEAEATPEAAVPAATAEAAPVTPPPEPKPTPEELQRSLGRRVVDMGDADASDGRSVGRANARAQGPTTTVEPALPTNRPVSPVPGSSATTCRCR